MLSIICSHIESTSNGSSNGKPHRLEIERPLDDYQNHLLDHLLQIFCKVRAIFVNVSIEKHVPLVFANRAINTLSCCLTSGIMVTGWVDKLCSFVQNPISCDWLDQWVELKLPKFIIKDSHLKLNDAIWLNHLSNSGIIIPKSKKSSSILSTTKTLESSYIRWILFVIRESWICLMPRERWKIRN